jgi:Flp pilus assembly protein TadB
VSELDGLVAALLIALIGAVTSYWMSIPRRTRSLGEKVRLLEALPEKSTQRESLLAHVDHLVELEIDADKANAWARDVWLFAGMYTTAWISTGIATRVGGTWWFLAVVSIVASVAITAALAFWLVRWFRRRRASRKSASPNRVRT